MDNSLYRKDGTYHVKLNGVWWLAKWQTCQDVDSSWSSWVIEGIEPPKGSWGFTDKDFEEIEEKGIKETQTV